MRLPLTILLLTICGTLYAPGYNSLIIERSEGIDPFARLWEATGRFYGQRSHCTVVHAVATVRNEIETNTFRRNQVQEIEDKLLKRKAIEISNEEPGDMIYTDPSPENLKHQKPVTSCLYSE